MSRQPTLLDSCARASSAAEARYRIDAPVTTRRVARVIALDDAAAAALRRVSATVSTRAHYLLAIGAGRDQVAAPDDLVPTKLRDVVDGHETELGVELADADLVLLVAGAGAGPARIREIGRHCRARGVSTVALTLGAVPHRGEVLAALRPFARMLLDRMSEPDLVELLSALRT